MTTLYEYLLENHDKLLYVLAGISLVVELGIMGMSGPLLFIAIGCAVSGMLVSFGLISAWEYEALSVGIISILSAAVLWKPLKNFQESHVVNDDSSDMIGQLVLVAEEVTLIKGYIRHSGINWQARLPENAGVESLAVDTRAVITAVDGNIMIVEEYKAS